MQQNKLHIRKTAFIFRKSSDRAASPAEDDPFEQLPTLQQT